jgi:hypothetical protein
MSNAPVVSVTDELVAELEAIAQDASFVTRESDSQEYLANLATRLLAERAELRRVIADVKWRVADTTDQLQATGFDGDRRYGLDEWSGPIKNLNMAIGILEKSLEQSK